MLNASSFHTLHQPLKAKHKSQAQSGCRYSIPRSCSNFASVPLRVGTHSSHLVRVRSRPPPRMLNSLKALSLLLSSTLKGSPTKKQTRTAKVGFPQIAQWSLWLSCECSRSPPLIYRHPQLVAYRFCFCSCSGLTQNFFFQMKSFFK